MKFLHVFDTAGTASLLNKHLRIMGHDSTILQLRQLDPFGFGDFYKNTIYFTADSSLVSYARTIEDEFDHVIVHDYAQHLQSFRDPCVFYHGSTLKHVFWKTDIDKKCKKIFLMMPHMIKYRPDGIPFDILVDRDHFSPRKTGTGKLCITNKRNLDLTKEKIDSSERYPAWSEPKARPAGPEFPH